MTSKEVPSVATCGSSDWTSVSSMMFRVPPCAVPAAEEAVPEAEEAATEPEEPPQAVRASAAEVTPAAARKLRREIRRSNLIDVSPLFTALVLYSAKASRSKITQGMSVPPSGTLHTLVLWRHYTAPFRKRKGVLQNLSAGCVHFCGLSNVAPKKYPDFCTISIHERISLFNKYT